MERTFKEIVRYFAIAILLFISGCGGNSELTKSTSSIDSNSSSSPAEPPKGFQPPAPEASPEIPDLQAELMDSRGKTTTSPLGNFDFRNFTYPLPRGWHHPDGDEITLEDGKLAPKLRDITDEMSAEEKAEARAERRIGMSYVTTKFLDADNDGEDEAAVVLKIETGGNAIPQLVYIFGWKDGKPELQWNFRTGDRADGGLKDIRAENGELVVELYGQDRFLLGQSETGKITGDEQQLCCPTNFTRSFYKWNGKNFQLQRKRLTFETDNPTGQPFENLGDIMNDPIKSKKFLEGR